MRNRYVKNTVRFKTFLMKTLMVILMFLPGYIVAQDCADILSKTCTHAADKDYKQFIITRAAYIKVNTPNLCSVVLPPNKDYLIKFCSEPVYKPLKIRLIDKQTNAVLYDNSKDGFAESTTFSVADHPIQILIEINVTRVNAKKNNNHEDPDKEEVESVCAGFWIYFKSSLISMVDPS